MPELLVGAKSPKMGGGDADPVRPILLEKNTYLFSVLPLEKNDIFQGFKAQKCAFMSGFLGVCG